MTKPQLCIHPTCSKIANDYLFLFCEEHLPFVPKHIYNGLMRRYDSSAIKPSHEFMELARHAAAALLGHDNNLKAKRKGTDGSTKETGDPRS